MSTKYAQNDTIQIEIVQERNFLMIEMTKQSQTTWGGHGEGAGHWGMGADIEPAYAQLQTYG